MRVDRWNQLKELFAAALVLPHAERDAFLMEACGADAELRAELADLLRAAEVQDGFLSRPVSVL